MTSFIAACGSGCCISLIPAVPAAWSVTTIACMIISLRSFVSLLDVLRRELELALGGTVRRYTGARRNLLLDCGPSHYAAFFTDRGGKASDHSHESARWDEPVAFELSQVLLPVVSVCGLRAPTTVNRVATAASPPYPSVIC